MGDGKDMMGTKRQQQGSGGGDGNKEMKTGRQ